MIENCIGIMPLPLGLGLGFKINGKDYLFTFDPSTFLLPLIFDNPDIPTVGTLLI